MEEGRSGGVEGFVAMLGRVGGKGIFQVGEKEAFQNLCSRTEEGDGAVGAAGVRGFAGLEEGDNFGGFPNGGDVGLLDGKVEDGGEVGFAGGTEVFEVVYGEVVGTYGTGVGGFGDGISDGVDCEREEKRVDWVFTVNFADDFAGGTVGGVAGDG